MDIYELSAVFRELKESPLFQYLTPKNFLKWVKSITSRDPWGDSPSAPREIIQEFLNQPYNIPPPILPGETLAEYIEWNFDMSQEESEDQLFSQTKKIQEILRFGSPFLFSSFSSTALLSLFLDSFDPNFQLLLVSNGEPEEEDIDVIIST